jgi:hypothetical protein
MFDSDTLTVITGNRPTNEYFAGSTNERPGGYALASDFKCQSVPARGLWDLNLSFQAMRRQSRSAIVRGAPKNAGDANAKFSLNADMFDDVPHHWLAFPINEHVARGNPASIAAVEAWIAFTLPRAFRSRDFIVVWGASAGTSYGGQNLMANVYFWLTKAISSGAAHRGVQSLGIATQLCSPVMVHRVVDPEFQGACFDPLNGRRIEYQQYGFEKVEWEPPQVHPPSEPVPVVEPERVGLGARIFSALRK